MWGTGELANIMEWGGLGEGLGKSFKWNSSLKEVIN